MSRCHFALWLVMLGGVLSGGPAEAQLAAGEPEQTTEPPPAPLRGPDLLIVATTSGRGRALSIEVEVKSPSGDPIELLPMLNGQPIRGVAISQSRGLALAKRYTLSFELPVKEGVLSLVAKAGVAQSEPAIVRLRDGAVERRPTLFLLAVGVAHYQDRQIPQLRYPGKDARDLATTLQQQRPQLYREVRSRVLADSEASHQRILRGFDWLQKNVAKEDTAVVFLAGHGTNDTDGRYYYLPFDSRADQSSMLSGTVIQESLRRIAGRVILMLDTCHSGNVLGRSSLTRLINDLTTENRIVVFAASTGDQAARESAVWQNGAFTKALVEGLRGLADYTADGQLSVSELETWASVRVRQLTSDVQTPTLAKPNAAPDYILAALPVSGALANPKQRVRQRLLGVFGGILAAGALIGIAVGVSQKEMAERNVLDLTFR